MLLVGINEKKYMLRTISGLIAVENDSGLLFALAILIGSVTTAE